MVQIALLHTVQSVADSFGKRLKASLDTEVKLYNFWDEFLAVNPNDVGEFSENNKERLFLDCMSMAMTGADFIVVTCSTLSPYLDEVRKEFTTPMIAIDDAMIQKAVKEAECILVVATAKSAIGPVTDKILLEAEKTDKALAVTGVVIEEAFEALKQNEMTKHDQIVKQAISKMDAGGYDLIVLAQASMENCAEDIKKITGVETISAPALCMREIKEAVERIAG